MPSQLHSGLILFQAVAHLFLPWLRVTPLVQSIFLKIKFILAKERVNSDIIYYWMTLKIFIHYRWISGWSLYNTLVQLFMPYWSTQGLQPILWKCGIWYWPRSCNWGDPSWVKSTSSFFQCTTRILWKWACAMRGWLGSRFWWVKNGVQI